LNSENLIEDQNDHQINELGSKVAALKSVCWFE